MNRLEFDDVEVSFEVHGEGDASSSCMPARSCRGTRPLIERLDGNSTLTYRRHLRRPDSGATVR